VPSRANKADLWDRRIARARELAREESATREALTFYAELAAYQRTLFQDAGEIPGAAGFLEAVDVAAASAAVPAFLSWLEAYAPQPLALSARDLRDEAVAWSALMRDFLERTDPAATAAADIPAAAKTFVVEAVLQPYAEAVAARRRDRAGRPPAAGPQSSRCPVCTGPPLLGVLREEGQGARRTLLCGRCQTEWDYLRVVCPSCLEERFDALPVYTADAFPHARIEACDTCRRYLKTIDLTKNGLAVPLVDDIASLPLDLWASDKGYSRACANLLRTSPPSRS
jgi:FdhE protein